jgi:hypothetical protein
MMILVQLERNPSYGELVFYDGIAGKIGQRSKIYVSDIWSYASTNDISNDIEGTPCLLRFLD